MEKNKLETDTLNETDLQRVYKYPTNPGDSKYYSGKRYVNLENGSMGGTHWTCFIVKDKE